MLYFVGVRKGTSRNYQVFVDLARAETAARNAALAAPGRVWIEGLQSASGRENTPPLSPEMLDAFLAETDQRFRLSADEQRQRDRARELQDPTTWRETISSMIEPALYSYQQKERSLEAILDFLWRVSVGCWPQDRIRLLGTFVFLAHRTKLEGGPLKAKPYPAYLRVGTADLILSIKTNEPGLRVTPRRSRDPRRDDPSSPAIERALDVLRAINWFEGGLEPAPDTIVEWVQARRREKGEEQPRGRPPKPSS